MLFMGEEWSARQPFRFFCDFGGELGDAVRRGRREEFKDFPDEVPDPLSEQTFLDSKLQWDDRAQPEHVSWLRWYQRLLAIRRAHIVPLTREIFQAGEWRTLGDSAVYVCWDCARGRELHLSANLSAEPHEFPFDDGRVLWHEGDKPEGNHMTPWSVRWTVSEA